MSENDETTSSTAQVEGAEEVLKNANLKEEEKEEEDKGMTDKADVKEDATSEE
jgi:hypothetical protein